MIRKYTARCFFELPSGQQFAFLLSIDGTGVNSYTMTVLVQIRIWERNGGKGYPPAVSRRTGWILIPFNCWGVKNDGTGGINKKEIKRINSQALPFSDIQNSPNFLMSSPSPLDLCQHPTPIAILFIRSWFNIELIVSYTATDAVCPRQTKKLVHFISILEPEWEFLVIIHVHLWMDRLKPRNSLVSFQTAPHSNSPAAPVPAQPYTWKRSLGHADTIWLLVTHYRKSAGLIPLVSLL